VALAGQGALWRSGAADSDTTFVFVFFIGF
jgi:hypothetical protein